MIWLTTAGCLLISFLFSGIEAGILCVDRVRLRHRANLGEPAALRLQQLLAHPGRLLVTVLIVTHLMNVTAMLLTTHELVEWLGPRGYAIAFLGWLPIYLFVVELLPKSLFRRFPFRALAALSGPLRAAHAVLAPIMWLGEWSKEAFWPEAKAEPRKLLAGREDFKYLTFESERHGTLQKTEREMIHAVLDFRSLTAGDLMIPLEKVVALPEEAPVPELLRYAAEHRAEWLALRTPAGEIQSAVRVLDVALDPSHEGRAGRFQRRLISVQTSESALAVMQKLRASRVQLATVQEDGAVRGLITSQRLAGRLMGSTAN